jgi:rRNA maturation RNase YbeY
MAITFQNQNIHFVLKQKVRIKKWLTKVIQQKGKSPGQINFVFTNDDELLIFNQRYLQHNTYTDIITFDSSEKAILNGDIIISIERVNANAIKFGIEFNEELSRVMVHGVLHLLGLKDKTSKNKKEMRLMEAWALSLLQKVK